MKKKIAIFQEDLGIGGIQRSLIGFLNQLDEKKYEVDLYLFKKGPFKELLPSFVNVIQFKNPFLRVEKDLPYSIWKYFLHFSVLKKEYDYAIDYNGYSHSCSACIRRVKSKRKIIWIHNDLAIKYQNESKYRIIFHFSKTKFKEYNTFVFVSNGAKEGFEKLVSPVSSYKIIPNYLDTNAILSQSLEDVSFDVDEEKHNFVFLGRLCYQKGVDLLLPEIKKLINERRDFHLYLIGDGPERKMLEEQTKALGISNYITFLGAKANPYPYLSKMNTFVCTSRYEGQGMVLLEAKCLGLDVIMSKHLEKYCEGIEGTTNLVDAMVHAKKKEKKIDKLVEYNNKIKKEINSLLGE